ncbi:class II glutamine amidotransferase [candidate division KSB1 bacterium]|nr:class II glutamine amidotransferase [candidate division KSB1 bacterium]
MCRMIMAVGEFDLNTVIDGFITMALDRNEKHEHNQDQEFKHRDGWGIAYWNAGLLDVYKSTTPCYEDKKIDEFRKVQTPLVLMHARRGSRGERKIENVHPFRVNGYVFFHNGTVKEPLSFNKEYLPEGDTDSEQFFFYVLSGMQDSVSISKFAEQLLKINQYSGMNTLLSNGPVTYVTNWHAYNERYYTMKLLRTDKAIIISSEVLPGYAGFEWERLRNRTIFRVETFGLGLERGEY